MNGSAWAGGSAWGHWLGRYGEEQAARYLIGAGYRLLDRNWVCRDPDLRGELDLVARFRRTVVVCEVKTRSGGWLADPVQAVTPDKAVRLRRLATRWLEAQRRAAGPAHRLARVRVDVIAIRTSARPPYPLRTLDHRIGVA